MTNENIPLEKDIQRAICEYLHSKNYFFWRSNNVPVFGRSNDGQSRFRALPKFTPRGIPDILMVHGGTLFGFEVKRPSLTGGNPTTTAAQKIFGENLERAGGRYFTVTSVEDVKKITGNFSLPLVQL
jgi:hypothetical protein